MPSKLTSFLIENYKIDDCRIHGKCADSLLILFAYDDIQSIQIYDSPLYRFQCQYTPLRYLEIKRCPYLKEFNIFHTFLDEIEFSDLPSLTSIAIHDTYLTSLDLSTLPSLESFYVGGNPFLTELWLSSSQPIQSCQPGWNYDQGITVIKYK